MRLGIVLQVVSLLGAGLILGAYVALQRGWWPSHGSAYLWCNFVGALALTGVAWMDRRLGFVLLEGAWAGVSLAAIVRPRPAGPHRRPDPM